MDQPPNLKPLVGSSVGPPGACMTPSMETWAPTIIFRIGHSPCLTIRRTAGLGIDTLQHYKVERRATVQRWSCELVSAHGGTYPLIVSLFRPLQCRKDQIGKNRGDFLMRVITAPLRRVEEDHDRDVSIDVPAQLRRSPEFARTALHYQATVRRARHLPARCPFPELGDLHPLVNRAWDNFPQLERSRELGEISSAHHQTRRSSRGPRKRPA